MDPRMVMTIVTTALAVILPSIAHHRPVASVPAFLLAIGANVGFCLGYTTGRDDLLGFLHEQDLLVEPSDTE